MSTDAQGLLGVAFFGACVCVRVCEGGVGACSVRRGMSLFIFFFANRFHLRML